MNPAALLLGLAAIVGIAVAKRPAHDNRRGILQTKLDVVLAKIKNRTATIADVERGIELAAELGDRSRAMQLSALLATLQRAAKKKRKLAATAKAAPKPKAPPPPLVSSPLDQISATAWREYARRMGTSKVGSVSPAYRLGVFQFSLPALEDLGYVTDVKRGTNAAIGDYDGKRQVYTATWKPPLTVQKFLADPALQVEAFNRMARSHWNLIREKHVLELGKKILGKEASVSGLMAVAAMAGPQGLARFLAQSDAERKKFPATEKKYLETTGLF